MGQRINTQSAHPFTVEKVVGMAEEYESHRETFLNAARWKFMGSGVCVGLAIGGGVALVIAQGKAEGPTGAWVAAESLLSGGGVALFGFGLSDKSEADNASRKATLLQGVLADDERDAGHLIGRGSVDFESRLVNKIVSESMYPQEKV